MLGIVQLGSPIRFSHACAPKRHTVPVDSASSSAPELRQGFPTTKYDQSYCGDDWRFTLLLTEGTLAQLDDMVVATASMRPITGRGGPRACEPTRRTDATRTRCYGRRYVVISYASSCHRLTVRQTSTAVDVPPARLLSSSGTSVSSSALSALLEQADRDCDLQ
jgi:hypothetical protein